MLAKSKQPDIMNLMSEHKLEDKGVNGLSI